MCLTGLKRPFPGFATDQSRDLAGLSIAGSPLSDSGIGEAAMQAMREHAASGQPFDRATEALGQRRRLWELAPGHHCAIVGICADPVAVRRLAAHLPGTRDDDDFDLHVRVVQQCSERNRLSRALHQWLDKRHAEARRRYQPSTDAVALQTQWRQDLARGRLAGAFWAVMTHPHCDIALARRVYADVHLFQHHQARLDQAQRRLTTSERSELDRCRTELRALQGRLADDVARRDARITDLLALLQNARGQYRVLEERLTRVEGGTHPRLAELERLSAAQAKEAISLRRTLDQLGRDHQEALAREQALQQLNATLMRQLESPGPTSDSSNTTPRPSGPVLAGQRVLLVGGRPRALPGYRDFIESLGGRFTHHDGGVEQAINQLDPALTSASLVLCQTDCVSHVAYWQVKRHCRRAGKHCIFLEREGLNSLSAGLADVLAVTRPDVTTTN